MSNARQSPSTPRDRVMRLYAIILKVLDNPGKWDFYDRQVGEAQRQAFAEMVANALSMAEQIAPESETSTLNVMGGHRLYAGRRTCAGITIHCDPTLPEGTAEFRDSGGRVLGKIINLEPWV